MTRWMKSIGAAVVLVALVVGVPASLVRLAGWPLPRQVPDLDNVFTMIQQGNIPADTVIKTIAVVVWLAWLQLLWSVLWEA
ncbi:MAG: hypothetical protein WA964_19035, partial [Ilumatobacter sp.]|uniref:hypothetical protein n=1 Tax=Ilumatobacter sp. TaxID=1967498 RepID=UPI003C7804F8